MPEATSGVGPGVDGLGPAVTFAVLGRVEMRVDGLDVAPTAPRALRLLALLLLAEGRVVAADTIVEELWGDRPPRRARSTVQTLVHQLRRSLLALGTGTRPETVLVTRAPGYLLAADPRRLDRRRFTDLCDNGRRRLARGDADGAARLLRAACDEWAGPPMANVAHGAVLAAEAAELLERRREARTLYVDAGLESGHHRELVGELGSLVAAHPLDEALVARWIRVLGRSGRRDEAMAAFRVLRDLLDAELGVAPGPEVHEAYGELLTPAAPAGTPGR